MAKDASGAFIVLNYKGVLNYTPAVNAIFTGSPLAKTTPFGDSCKFSSVLLDKMKRR